MKNLKDLVKIKEGLFSIGEIDSTMRIYQRLHEPKRMYVIMHEKGFKDLYYTIIYILPKMKIKEVEK